MAVSRSMQRRRRRYQLFSGQVPQSSGSKGVGHFFLVEKPTEINERVLRFLGE
jgi:pimeloyl-ACP methyl ester carboxylesterase